jgi:hypothetical protein
MDLGGDEVKQILKSWLVFGEHPNGNVDVSDGECDLFENISRDKAAAIIEAREEFVLRVFHILVGGEN